MVALKLLCRHRLSPLVAAGVFAAAALTAATLPADEPACMPLRQHDQVWLVSQRRLGCDTRQVHDLEYWRYDAHQGWVRSNLDEFRGKSAEKVQLMIRRADAEAGDFERCTARLAALRSVQAKLVRETLTLLASDQLRDEMLRMGHEIGASFFNLGAKKAFVALCARLRERIAQARERNAEAYQMLEASFRQLNTDYGFALGVVAAPTLDSQAGELDQIERSYVHYLGLSNALKLSEPRFMEQFRRMLLSKLRTIFENATGEVELWHKSASTQTDSQLRERRRDFKRRREALERVSSAAGELEARIAEIEEDDRAQQQLLVRMQAQATELLMLAEEGPQALLAPPDQPKAVLTAA